MTTEAKAILILGRDGVGDNASQEDFEAYVRLVERRIAPECGFKVDVVFHAGTEVQSTKIQCSGDDVARVVNAAYQRIRDAFARGDR